MLANTGASTRATIDISLIMMFMDELTLDQVTRAGEAVIDPAKLTWVVIGDRESIEAGLAELNLGEIRLIDVEGNLIDDATTRTTTTN